MNKSMNSMNSINKIKTFVTISYLPSCVGPEVVLTSSPSSGPSVGSSCGRSGVQRTNGRLVWIGVSLRESWSKSMAEIRGRERRQCIKSQDIEYLKTWDPLESMVRRWIDDRCVETTVQSMATNVSNPLKRLCFGVHTTSDKSLAANGSDESNPTLVSIGVLKSMSTSCWGMSWVDISSIGSMACVGVSLSSGSRPTHLRMDFQAMEHPLRTHRLPVLNATLTTALTLTRCLSPTLSLTVDPFPTLSIPPDIAFDPMVELMSKSVIIVVKWVVNRKK